MCPQSLEGLFFQALPPRLPKSSSAGCVRAVCLSISVKKQNKKKSTRECVKLHLEACKGDNKREEKLISQPQEPSNPPIPETSDGSPAKSPPNAQNAALSLDVIHMSSTFRHMRHVLNKCSVRFLLETGSQTFLYPQHLPTDWTLHIGGRSKRRKQFGRVVSQFCVISVMHEAWLF